MRLSGAMRSGPGAAVARAGPGSDFQIGRKEIQAKRKEIKARRKEIQAP
jgi:hypothetical protein